MCRKSIANNLEIVNGCEWQMPCAPEDWTHPSDPQRISWTHPDALNASLFRSVARLPLSFQVTLTAPAVAATASGAAAGSAAAGSAVSGVAVSGIAAVASALATPWAPCRHFGGPLVLTCVDSKRLVWRFMLLVSS
jgi:hypothetical protein